MASALRDYLELVSGLTEVTRQRAVAAAKGLLSSSGAELVVPGAIGQASALADEIMATAKANRELLTGMIRAEIDRAVSRLGLATRDDLAAVQRRVDRLAAHQGEPAGSAPDAAEPGQPRRGTKKAATKKAATKKAATKKAATKKAATKKAATKKAATKKAVPDQAVPDQAVPEKAVPPMAAPTSQAAPSSEPVAAVPPPEAR